VNLIVSKEEALVELARTRRSAHWGGYKCIGDYHGGAYECLFVSPYTKGASNVDAQVMVMLQDWSSDLSLSGPLDQDSVEIGHAPHLATNKNLKRLLSETFDLTLAETYGTNLFPFIKLGRMSAKIPRSDLVRAAREFGIPQIKIVSPRLVICLGLAVFNALRETQGLTRLATLSLALESSFNVGASAVWCQAHTGTLGQNTRNRNDRQRASRDWLQMKEAVSVGGELTLQAQHS
jgi:uracil-DNA glycosylase